MWRNGKSTVLILSKGVAVAQQEERIAASLAVCTEPAIALSVWISVV